MPGKSRAEIVDIISTNNNRRLDAMPDTAIYPELRGMRELIEAEWRGVEDGAGLSAEQCAAHHDSFWYMRRILTKAAKPPAACTCVYFPFSDHGALFAFNLDSSLSEPVESPRWPALNEHLLAGWVSSGVFDDEESPEIFPAPIFKLLSRYCRSTAEAVEMLTRYKLFWGPCNMLIMDRRHNVAMIEKSACRIGVRYSPDGFGFVTAMTAAEPGMNKYLAERRAASLVARGLGADSDDALYWQGADKRRHLLDELLDEARARPTMEGLRQILQFRASERGTVCYNGELLPGGMQLEHTICTSIFLLDKRCAKWWAFEDGKPSFTNPKQDIAFSDVLPWQQKNSSVGKTS